MKHKKIFKALFLLMLVFSLNCEVSKGNDIKGETSGFKTYPGEYPLDNAGVMVRLRISAKTNTDIVSVGESVDITTVLETDGGMPLSGSKTIDAKDLEITVGFISTANASLSSNSSSFKLKSATTANPTPDSFSGVIYHNTLTPNSIGTIIVTAIYYEMTVTVTIPVEGLPTGGGK